MNERGLILLLLAATTVTMSACGDAGDDSSSVPPTTTSVTPGPEVDPFVYDETKFEEERNQMLRNLTDTDEQYDYYLNKDPEFDYTTYKRTDKINEFLSQGETVYNDINGKDVTTNYYYWPGMTQLDHPNVGMGLLLYKAIKYKLQYPEQPNEVGLTSFHFALTAGLNLVKNSKYYGTMKRMSDEYMDRDGYVRISYLAAYAASIGIDVYIIPQLGSSNAEDSMEALDEYYESLVDLPCSAKHSLADHTIGEFLHYTPCRWVSYGAKSASDMFHIKTTYAKHYLSDQGTVYDNTLFTSSANLDSVYDDGTIGLNVSQTGFIVSNHEYLYRTLRNFVVYVSDYCSQDDVFEFRKNFKDKIIEQKAAIKTAGYESIKDEMMIYLGSPQDSVFELQITPFTDYMTNWTDDNPYCKYVDKLNESKGAISFYFTNPKFSFNGDFLQSFMKKTINSFLISRPQEEVDKSVFYVGSPASESMFSSIVIGTHAGRKVINNKANHQKDILFEYEEAGLRYSTLVLTTSNYHSGSNFYQVNSCLLVKQIEGVNTGVSDAFKACYEQYELKVN